MMLKKSRAMILAISVISLVMPVLQGSISNAQHEKKRVEEKIVPVNLDEVRFTGVLYTSEQDGDSDIYMGTLSLEGISPLHGVINLSDNDVFDNWADIFPPGELVVYSSSASGKKSGSSTKEDRGDRDGFLQLVLKDLKTGRTTQLTSEDEHHLYPSFSQDGRKIVFASGDEGSLRLSVFDLEQLQSTDVTEELGNIMDPAFAPDGGKIVFSLSRGGGEDFRLYEINLDGTGMKQLTPDDLIATNPAFSLDGTRLAFEGISVEPEGKSKKVGRVGGASSVYLMDLATKEITEISKTGNCSSPTFAWDGRLLFYFERQIIYGKSDREIFLTIDDLAGNRFSRIKLKEGFGNEFRLF